MAEKEIKNQDSSSDTVYVLEGEPDEVFNAQGERIEVTPEQEKEIEDQI